MIVLIVPTDAGPQVSYHKGRSRWISRSLHSVSSPIFPIQWRASWRCVLLYLFSTADAASVADEAEAAAAAAAAEDDGDEDEDAEAEGGGGSKATVREATVSVTASGFCPPPQHPRPSPPSPHLDSLVFVIPQKGRRDVRRSLIGTIMHLEPIRGRFDFHLTVKPYWDDPN